MKYATVITLLVLCSCAVEPPRSFQKEDMSHYRQDAYECERDVRNAAPSFGRGIAGMMEAEEFAIRCMAAKGYGYY